MLRPGGSKLPFASQHAYQHTMGWFVPRLDDEQSPGQVDASLVLATPQERLENTIHDCRELPATLNPLPREPCFEAGRIIHVEPGKKLVIAVGARPIEVVRLLSAVVRQHGVETVDVNRHSFRWPQPDGPPVDLKKRAESVIDEVGKGVSQAFARRVGWQLAGKKRGEILASVRASGDCKIGEEAERWTAIEVDRLAVEYHVWHAKQAQFERRHVPAPCWRAPWMRFMRPGAGVFCNSRELRL